MKNQEFSPRESLERAFGRWWVILLLTALGGMVGWTIHFFLPPLYEATAVITANMDFQKGKLTQQEEDYTFNAAGAIGTSTEVENQIVAEAQKRGFPIDINQLQQQMFFEREQSVWLLHIRNRNPQIASELANLWAEKFYAALNADVVHAIRANQIQTQIDTINTSFSVSGSPVLSSGTQAALQNLSDELLQEQQASQGVSSIMKFALTESATVPQKPVIFYLADLVLAGACIGFVVSLWAVSSYKVQRHG
jgi:capsular polysaccharide biosynthesis protein